MSYKRNVSVNVTFVKRGLEEPNTDTIQFPLTTKLQSISIRRSV